MSATLSNLFYVKEAKLGHFMLNRLKPKECILFFVLQMADFILHQKSNL